MNLPHAHILLVMIFYSSILSLSFLAYTDAKKFRSEESLENDVHVFVVIVDINLLTSLLCCHDVYIGRCYPIFHRMSGGPLRGGQASYRQWSGQGES